jgi:transposase
LNKIGERVGNGTENGVWQFYERALRTHERYDAIVILSDMQGLSYEEISQALDIPIGTVRSRLNRGRRHLQKALWDEAVRSGYVTDTKMNPMKRWSNKLFRSLRGK